MRRLIVMVLVGSLAFLTACSYLTDFVIVNESDGPIIVRYVVKDYPGRFEPPEIPKVVSASELSESRKQWSSIQYALDDASRSVTVQLMPGQALRITTLHHYTSHDDAYDAQQFQMREIMLSGNRGELNLTGEQARTTFTKVSWTLYTLTYR